MNQVNQFENQEKNVKPKAKATKKKYSDKDEVFDLFCERIIELAMEKTGWSREKAAEQWDGHALAYVTGRIANGMRQSHYATYIPEGDSEKVWVIDIETGDEITNEDQINYLFDHLKVNARGFWW